MVRFLYRFANTDLDQFDHVKFDTKYGDVFISISRSSGGYDDVFRDITHVIQGS